MGQEASLRLWLVGRVSRLAGRVAEVLPAGVALQQQLVLPEALLAAAPGDLLLIDLQDLLRHGHAERAAWVRAGLLHPGKLLLLDEERLVFHPVEDLARPDLLPVEGASEGRAAAQASVAKRLASGKAVAETARLAGPAGSAVRRRALAAGVALAPWGGRAADVSAALQGIFNKRTASNRHQTVFHRWQQCMTESAVLDCQRWLKMLPLSEPSLSAQRLHGELRRQQHLLQATQLHLRQLLQFMSERKVVSWEARSLLDTANALLMVCNVMEPDELNSSAELNEYGQIIHETLLRFQQQLTAALFCYQEQLAFHWFFTEQRIGD
jgi:hypothetical protein